jgi:uncharacterized membrane protein
LEEKPQNDSEKPLDSSDDAELAGELAECEENDITPLERKVERRVVNVLETRLQQQLFFQGPLPPPAILKGYDLVQPGLASRIVELAEKQADHRMILEKKIVFGDQNKSLAGLILGFILSCGVSYGGYALIMSGHDIAGAAIDITGITSLIGTFVYGTNQRKKERIEKSKLMDNSNLTDDE